MTTLYDERRKGRRVAPDALYLAELEPPARGRRIITDNHREAPKGFAVRVNVNGATAFVLRYMHDGRDRLLTIGEYPTWSLAAAREQARAYRQEIDAGTDILEARRAERAEPTVADVSDRFLAAKRKAGMKSADDVAAVFRLYLLPALGQKRLNAVRRRDVIAVVERLAETRPRQASLLLAYVKQAFAWAEDRELLEANPVATLRASKVSSALAQRPRARVLDEDEIKALWNGVEAAGLHRMTALALKLMLVTGQRSGEVGGMCWSEVRGKTWTIPASRRKTGTEHTVPLTDTALELLEAAQTEAERLSKRRKTEATDHVFAARPGRPLTPTSVARAVSRYAAEIGNKPKEEGRWRPHDLRRTVRTGLAAASVPETIAEAVIGHTRQGIVAVYDRHRYEVEKRKALEAWERRLLRIAAGEPVDQDNVVALTEGRT